MALTGLSAMRPRNREALKSAFATREHLPDQGERGGGGGGVPAVSGWELSASNEGDGS